MFEPLGTSAGARLGWPSSSRPSTQSFGDYLQSRRYDYGRGSRSAWSFIAFARGVGQLPDARRWQELHQYLCEIGATEELIEGARTVWRSFGAYRAHARRRAAAEEGWNDGRRRRAVPTDVSGSGRPIENCKAREIR
jgi:hypothetical protein